MKIVPVAVLESLLNLAFLPIYMEGKTGAAVCMHVQDNGRKQGSQAVILVQSQNLDLKYKLLQLEITDVLPFIHLMRKL